MNQRRNKSEDTPIPEPSLQVEPLPAERLLAGEGLLGVIGPRQAVPAGIAEDLPVVRIHAPILAQSAPIACEALRTHQAITAGHCGDIHYRQTDHFIFGLIELDESRIAGGPAASPLLRAAEGAYRDIFRLLDEMGYSTLLRAWNYIAQINDDEGGLERYRQFNVGRQNAFVSDGRSITGSVPAACALGVGEGPLQIAFLGSRLAMRAIENPRQVSAYYYPTQYRPRSPTFSRAALFNAGHDEILFISGTASIVGHESVHLGDPVAQVAESLNNVAALLDQANKVRHARFPCEPTDVCYRVYLRRREDLAAVRAEFERIVGPEAVAVYVVADVCRRELLVEVEGSAMLARGNPP